ncbi:MAG: flagellar basal body-associated protein FliL [Burkholderiales bacterium]|nr:flagellar basal body-associated protein FliL [Burkholderiales bacterium]
MATSAAAVKAPVEAPASAPKKKSNLLLIGALVVVLLAAGGAGAWWFVSQSHSEDEEAETVAPKPSIFLPLDQFTVNLQPEEGQQFLQTALTLKVSEQDIADAIKAQMPEVRSRLLFLLSSKKPSQLSTLEGKNKLIEEITLEVEAVLPPVKPKAKKSKKDAESKSAKKGKGKKSKAKEDAQGQEDEPQPRRVLAVFFTHFIVQ